MSRFCSIKISCWKGVHVFRNYPKGKLVKQDVFNTSIYNRYFSIRSGYNLIPNYKKMGNEEEKEEYKSYFAYVMNALKGPFEEFPELQKYYLRLLESNVPHYKQATGFTVVTVYKSLAHNLTPENIRLANLLGWCVDMSLCWFIIVDDIIDCSETRYGFPSWYRNKGTGKRAIIDGQILGNSPYTLFKKYFSNHNCYPRLIELFRKVNLKIATGQALDMMAVSNEKPQFNIFTTEVYQNMVKNKSGYPFFVLPTVAAMHLAEKYEKELYQNIKSILLRLGEYLQIQNDISDCYGNLEITGKKGNDIGQGKNTWLIVRALESATTAQHKILRKHYGNPNPESEQKILAVYDSLHILEHFLQYEEDTYNNVCKDILKLPYESFRNHLLNLTDAVFVRNNALF